MVPRDFHFGAKIRVWLFIPQPFTCERGGVVRVLVLCRHPGASFTFQVGPRGN